jgi:cytochrome oxidase assembly protein ShyY1
MIIAMVHPASTDQMISNTRSVSHRQPLAMSLEQREWSASSASGKAATLDLSGVSRSYLMTWIRLDFLESLSVWRDDLMISSASRYRD